MDHPWRRSSWYCLKCSDEFALKMPRPRKTVSKSVHGLVVGSFVMQKSSAKKNDVTKFVRDCGDSRQGVVELGRPDRDQHGLFPAVVLSMGMEIESGTSRGLPPPRRQHLLEFLGFIREGLKLDAFAINLHIYPHTRWNNFFQPGWRLVVM